MTTSIAKGPTIHDYNIADCEPIETGKIDVLLGTLGQSCKLNLRLSIISDSTVLESRGRGPHDSCDVGVGVA